MKKKCSQERNKIKEQKQRSGVISCLCAVVQSVPVEAVFAADGRGHVSQGNFVGHHAVVLVVAVAADVLGVVRRSLGPVHLVEREGVVASTDLLLRLFSGWLRDRPV